MSEMFTAHQPDYDVTSWSTLKKYVSTYFIFIFLVINNLKIIRRLIKIMF
jgi:hypothetical protein